MLQDVAATGWGLKKLEHDKSLAKSLYDIDIKAGALQSKTFE
jgi:hypothetical protein